MKKDSLIIANWKMNLNINSSEELLLAVKEFIKVENFSSRVIFCPQHLLIHNLSRLFDEQSQLFLGAQDCHNHASGAYTGDNSIELLKEFNCKYVIVGHSERRNFHSESNRLINEKIRIIEEFSLKSILCVGELIEDRKNKNYLNFISKQLLDSIPSNVNELIIAYEPIWSIGSGLVPQKSEIHEVVEFINFCVKKHFPEIKKLNILYGGSVNSLNIEEIMSIDMINGVLVGGASIKKEEFIKILKRLI